MIKKNEKTLRQKILTGASIGLITMTGLFNSGCDSKPITTNQETVVYQTTKEDTNQRVI